MHKQNMVAAAAASMVLAACGGGGGDDSASGPSPSSPYVTYSGNTNGHIVLDGASTQFAVKSSNQKLVHLSSTSELNGLLVASNGDIAHNGQKIAAIILTTGQDGKSIATLACTGPAPNYGAMTITISGGSWTYKCASNTGGGSNPGSDSGGGSGGGTGGGSGGGGTGGGSGGNTSGQSADQCVKLAAYQYGGLGITNTCNVTINYSYCNLRPDSSNSTLFQCKARPHSPSPTGYIYGQGADSLAPGRTHQILGTSGVANQKTWVKACVSPDFPYISDFNTATITSNSSAFGYCSK